jgi:hypothetical protein
MASSTGRKIGIVIAIVVIFVVLILLFVPLEPTSDRATGLTAEHCAGVGSCPVAAYELTVGDGRYATLSGSWLTNASGSDVVVTINDGSSAQACANCSGQLYTSAGSSLPSGAFDVSGFGPFHISVLPLANGNQSTTLLFTLDSAIL